MAKKSAFEATAEKETMKRITAIGFKMAQMQENLHLLKEFRRREKFLTPQVREQVLSLAGLDALKREVNQAIREHWTKCSCCGREYSLSEYMLIYAGALDNDAVIQCRVSYGKRMSASEGTHMLLDSKEWGSVRELLKYSFAPLGEIFSLPR